MPGNAQAHLLVGLIAHATDDGRPAMSAFGSVTRLDPRHCAGWARLAGKLVLAGQANRAEQALRAVRDGSTDPVVQDLIATAHSLLGDQGTTQAWHFRAVRGDRCAVRFRVNLANNLVCLG